MSDPRGHGIKRGTGKWHRPQYILLPPQPSDYGWQATIERGPFRIIWVRDEYRLTGSNLTWTATNTETGDVFQFEDTHIQKVGFKLFGDIPFTGQSMTAPAEITMADFYGVA